MQFREYNGKQEMGAPWWERRGLPEISWTSDEIWAELGDGSAEDERTR
jgi:hypothetical protein